MPKVSKINSTRPKPAPPPEPPKTEYTCCRCGKKFKKQKSYFPASQSPLYKGNGGYLCVCSECVDQLYQHYRDSLGDDAAAIRRMCLKFDIYWSPEIYKMIENGHTSQSRIRVYITRTNLYKYIGKSYDDTLDEEAEVARIAQEAREREEAERAEREGDEAEMRAMEAELEAFEAANKTAKAKEPEPEPTQEQVDFWGDGYAYSMYNDLDRRYQKWIEGRGEVSNATSLLIKQIAIMEATIDRESAAGRSTEKYVKPLNDLLAALNLQPSQQESLGEFEAMPFGVGIRVYENRKPIPEPDPDFKDFDGIVRYISTWFLGHLCKMLHIKNSYSRMYEDAIAKLRVDRPELDEEDDEDLFNDIFGDDGAGGGAQ